MPTPGEIRDAVDARLATMWAAVQTREANFLAAHGRYFQGIRTHAFATPPADGGETPPDPTGHPTDQPENWTTAGFTLPATLPMSVELHTYHGPQGRGFVGVVRVRINANVWTRAAQVGPETWRSHPWRQE